MIASKENKNEQDRKSENNSYNNKKKLALVKLTKIKQLVVRIQTKIQKRNLVKRMQHL